VTDHGKPVRGLTADDFEVLEDGQPQKVTNFYAVLGGAPPPSAAEATQDERFRRKVFVIVDSTSVTRYERARALSRLEVRLKNGKRGKLEYRSSCASSSIEAQIERAMQSPVAAALLPAALPVSLATGVQQPDKRGVTVPISVRVPFSALQFLPAEKGTAAHVGVCVSVFDDVGKNLFTGNFPMTLRFSNGTVEPHGTMVYKNAVVLSKGTKNQIITAVRDETTDVIGCASESVQTEQ